MCPSCTCQHVSLNVHTGYRTTVFSFALVLFSSLDHLGLSFMSTSLRLHHMIIHLSCVCEWGSSTVQKDCMAGCRRCINAGMFFIQDCIRIHIAIFVNLNSCLRVMSKIMKQKCDKMVMKREKWTPTFMLQLHFFKYKTHQNRTNCLDMSNLGVLHYFWHDP